MSFWNYADFAFQHEMVDPINDEIWSQSVKIHGEKGFTPAELAASGYGAQQAMLPAEASVLPWVPDVLGSEWDHPEAVHIVGMAYAGFIKELSDRCFPLEEYVKDSKGSWRDFARTYLSLVIRGDQKYYEPLCPVLEYFASSGRSRFCLFDLCRASLVKREVNRPRDKPIRLSKADPLAQKCVASYCEHRESQRWTWDRLSGGLASNPKSSARPVIALGLTAEHGLLKLFLGNKQHIWDSSAERKPWSDRSKNSASPLWTVNYAGSKLGKRLQSPTWWCVGPSLYEAKWHIIPIYHPSFVSRSCYDPGYKRTLERLLPAAAVFQNG